TLAGGIYSMLMITIERYVSTTRYKTYESSGRSLGVALSAVQLTLSGAFYYLIIYFYDLNRIYARCNVVSEEGLLFHRIQGGLLTCVQLFSITAFYSLLRYNKRLLDTRGLSLTERYQLSENVRTLHLLVPVVSSHISLNLLVVISYLESLGFLHLHSVIVPCILYLRYRRELYAQQRLRRANATDDAGFSERHITIVQSAW
ncbi:hypothetical protein PFISCL1PPCAC_17843, partial [Pristionchus fissidentatus]